ncbi:MAG TPA: DUF2089 domain-containing protein [Chloroflexota bacterium]|jgi:hypothetical protein|nr:DUF2089 domain-containing protein [Chloroflexota bacterium]
MPELTGRCPMCEAELVVTHLRCQRCGTGLEGTFQLNKFDRLSREQLRFVDVFIKNRGVIRDVERELSISYPTVRNRLDEVIRALGYDVSGDGTATPQEPQPAAGAVSLERRREILDQLAAGEITADQAVVLLQGGEPEPATGR